jgi:hypothetical protein
MEVYVLNKSFEPVAVIDVFKSLIWTKRYYTFGDFELYIPADSIVLQYIKPDYYLQRKDDDAVMIIEKLRIATDAENGDYFIVSGRSLESILLRRVFAQQFILNNTGSLSDAVSAMLTECTTDRGTFLRPQGYRSLPITVEQNTISGQMDIQFTGQTLLDAIISICKPKDVGIKVTLSGQSMILSMYHGEEVPVTFSPDFDNLISSEYSFDTSNLRQLIYCAGEGEGENRIIDTYQNVPFIYTPIGIEYREMFADARDISSNNGAIGNLEYLNMLSERSKQKLAENSIVETFEASIVPDMTYKYKTDYNLGDVVTVKNEYGITSKPRIIEIIECWDDTGYSVIPTFDALEVQ